MASLIPPPKPDCRLLKGPGVSQGEAMLVLGRVDLVGFLRGGCSSWEGQLGNPKDSV